MGEVVVEGAAVLPRLIFGIIESVPESTAIARQAKADPVKPVTTSRNRLFIPALARMNHIRATTAGPASPTTAEKIRDTSLRREDMP
jgi:hypothetical protein